MAQVDVAAVGGLELGAVVSTLSHHAVPGSEELSPPPSLGTSPGDDARPVRYRRLLEVDGAPTAITLILRSDGVAVESPRDTLEGVVELVTWWFDLDTDPAPVASRLSRDSRLAPLVAQRPALRPLRHPVGFEAAVDTVLGQQVTLASARLFAQRLRTAYSPGAVAGLARFPSPETLVGAPTEELRAAVGLTTARATTVRAVAALFADGFRLGPGSDPAAARAALLGVPGIGPWTVEYLALRALGDPDAFASSDAVVRRALDGVSAGDALRAADGWRPHRAWATAHLWAGQTAPR